MNKIAAIYIRVSTDAQIEGYSIDAQKEQLTAYCISKGIKSYDYYIDGGFTGSNMNRPELQRLIKDAKDRKISHCIVFKLDRLSRSQKDTLYLIEDVLNPNDVSFVSLNESMDTSTPMGRLMLGILSAFAQLERENIRLRTRMGMHERVKAGYWMGGGRVPFGYDYDKNEGILVLNKDSEKVRQLYKMYLDGYSLQGIADILGLKYDRLARQILTRKCNYGVIEYNGKVYQGRHEPIIDKDTYDRAMEEMNRRSNNNITTSNYLLTGLLYCGKCGAKIRYQKWGKDKIKLVCYSQQKGKPYLVKDENCDLPRIDKDEVENLVIKELFKLKPIKVTNESNNKVEKTALELLDEQKTTVEQKIKKLYNLYAETDDDLLLQTIKENQDKLNTINKKINRELEHNVSAKGIEKYNDAVYNLEERWKIMSFMQRQQIVRILVNKVTVYDDSVQVTLTF